MNVFCKISESASDKFPHISAVDNPLLNLRKFPSKEPLYKSFRYF